MAPNAGNQTPKNDLWGRVIVGSLLFIFSAGFVIGLLWRLLYDFANVPAGLTAVDRREVNEAIIMIFAGGMGSCIYAIRAYLKHACENGDFDAMFVPWYLLWLIQGSLLAMIFYFAIRGGLLFITLNSGAGQTAGASTAISLNTWSLAAIGALVGLFSKYAIEKLRKVIVITFGDKATLDADEADDKLQLEKRKAKLQQAKEQAKPA